MRKLIICCMLVPFAAWAQNFGGMSPDDMQKMMQQAKETQACVAEIDQAELEKLKVRSEEMVAEVDALCDAGDKAKARATAVSYAQEIEKEPVMAQLKGCVGIMSQQIPALAWSELEEPGSKNTDVCELAK